MKKILAHLLIVVFFCVLYPRGSHAEPSSTAVADNVLCSEQCSAKTTDAVPCLGIPDPVALNICAYGSGYLEACFEGAAKAYYIATTLVAPPLHAEIIALILDSCDIANPVEEAIEEDMESARDKAEAVLKAAKKATKEVLHKAHKKRLKLMKKIMSNH